MSAISERLSECLITGSPVTKILDFGQHAYADTFIAESQVGMSEPVFPLQLFLNSESGSIQLGFISDAEDRYNLYGYSYTSSNSQTARNHWNEFAKTTQTKYPGSKLAVEIGSNDGYLINQFKGVSKTILGVDSSREMCDLATSLDINTVYALFDSESARVIEENYGKADIIMANNVFNHANDPVAFAKAIAALLSNDGVFIFEVPYWYEMVKSGRFVDMVYHEHISYFTIKSCWNLLKAAGLEIVDYGIVNYHGGSLRVEAKLAKGRDMPTEVKDAIDRETILGLFSNEFYVHFQKKLEEQRNQWLLNFYKILTSDPNAVIIGVGAAAKANTWLNWHKLDKTLLKYITDSSSFKQGKYTPLSRIPIVGDEIFAQYEAPYALVLSWNIGDALKNALQKINPNVRFISQ
jgi:SAM-dependent methyltransferase